MVTPMKISDTIVWDYAQHPGPYCIEHRSTQCTHAIDAIMQRADVPFIEKHFETFRVGSKMKLMVPLFPEHFMWEDMLFELVANKAIGTHGRLIPRGQHETYDTGVRKIIRGESAKDLAVTMVQQFKDIMELEPPAILPGCRSPNHKVHYQQKLERVLELARRDPENNIDALMPHLYGLVGRSTPMCAFCWADSFGSDARRVSSDASVAAAADDFDDLMPDESMSNRGRR